MANQDVNKKQNMQEQKNQKTEKSGGGKEFSSSDKMRDSDISKQSGQGVKSDTREEPHKRK